MIELGFALAITVFVVASGWALFAWGLHVGREQVADEAPWRKGYQEGHEQGYRLAAWDAFEWEEQVPGWLEDSAARAEMNAVLREYEEADAAQVKERERLIRSGEMPPQYMEVVDDEG
jgi:hypothetical protein